MHKCPPIFAWLFLLGVVLLSTGCIDTISSQRQDVLSPNRKTFAYTRTDFVECYYWAFKSVELSHRTYVIWFDSYRAVTEHQAEITLAPDSQLKRSDDFKVRLFFSPDSSHLAAVCKQRIWIIDLDKSQAALLAKADSDIAGFRWIDPKCVEYMIQASPPKTEPDSDTKRLRMAVWRQTLPDGKATMVGQQERIPYLW